MDRSAYLSNKLFWRKFNFLISYVLKICENSFKDCPWLSLVPLFFMGCTYIAGGQWLELCPMERDALTLSMPVSMPGSPTTWTGSTPILR